MNRRGFLGSVIGLVAGGNFLARLATEPPQRIILPSYRMAFREVHSGLLVQAPGVKSITKVKGGFDFVAEDLEVTQTMLMRGVALFDKHGRLIKETKFSCDVPMTLGDRLKCTQHLTCTKDFATADELIAAYFKEIELGRSPKEIFGKV